MGGRRDLEFQIFVAECSPRLYRLASGLVMNGQQPEDLVQTTLLNLWRSWPKARDADSPQAYARQALVNATISARRRRWHNERSTAELPETVAADETRGVELRDQVRQAMRRLPPRQRAAISLRYLEDLPDNEIAALLGCTVQTVRSQISRGLASMRGTPNPPDQPDEAAANVTAHRGVEEAPSC